MSQRGTRKATMRAWAINAYGSPGRMQLLELPMPEPGPDDVLIRMAGAEVGDWDIMVREGDWTMGRPFPLVLGLAGAGTVADLGRGTTDFDEDDPVYAYSYPLYDNGSWAEYMLVPSSYAARAPASLELARAGGVPIVGLTAHETLTDILEVHRGDVVLVTAAAGGVGHLAVQIASRLGGRVIATASRRNESFVRGLGAEAVIDYQSEDLLEAIRSRYPRGVDKAINGVEGETANQVVQALRDGGQMVDLTGSATAERPDVRVVKDYVVRADGDRLASIARMIDRGHLKVEIQQVVPFEGAPAALERVQDKHVRGKLVLQIE
jgi:NADPH:quinone reductase